MADQVGIYNHSTGENLVLEMTEEEITVREKEIKDYFAKKQETESKAEALIAAKEAAQAKLAALGLTMDDLKALGL